VGQQTELVLGNIKVILCEAGSCLSKVVKVTIFLQDLNDFVEVNDVYAKYFWTEPPARSTVEAVRLPQDARIEIDVIALA
jgi:2-iminobutanoate/2-iminopropanoate deaminase